MTFTAVGSLQNGENAATGTSTTFSLTTTTAGDFILASLLNGDGGLSGQQTSNVTSTRVTWTDLVSAGPLDTAYFGSIWLGVVNSAGSDTVTVTYAASMGGRNSRFDAREFHSTVTSSPALDTSGTVSSAGGTSNWATLTPSGAGRLYWGWCENSGSASGTNGTPPGFIYEPDSNGNGEAYNLSVSAPAHATWNDSGQIAGVMVLVAETVTAAPGPAYTASMASMLGEAVTWSAISTLFQTDAGPWTFTPPAGALAGDLVCVEISNRVNATVYATALSSSNATWTPAAHYLGVNLAVTVATFFGKITSTSAASVTITWSGTAPGTIRGDGQVFRSTVGSWALDASVLLDSAGGVSAWPNLVASAAGDLYFGWASDTGSASAGSTSGYTYQVDGRSNGVAYNLNCSSGTVTGPTWGDSGQSSGMMVLVKEQAAAVVVAPAPGFPVKAKLPGQHDQVLQRPGLIYV